MRMDFNFILTIIFSGFGIITIFLGVCIAFFSIIMNDIKKFQNDIRRWELENSYEIKDLNIRVKKLESENE